MRMPIFYRAFLICIRTVEYSDPSLLIDIDPKLVKINPILLKRKTNSSNSSLLRDFKQQMMAQINQLFHHQMKNRKMIFNINFVWRNSCWNIWIFIDYLLDPLAQQNSLHRRIHSDPIFSIPKESTSLNRSCVVSPPPPSSSPSFDEIPSKQQEAIPSISYIQTEECGSYASSYDSRGDTFDQNKQPKIILEQSLNSDNNRQSISSQITLVDEHDSLYEHQLSSIPNTDETILSTTSTSPMDRSATISTIDYPTQSKILLLTLINE